MHGSVHGHVVVFRTHCAAAILDLDHRVAEAGAVDLLLTRAGRGAAHPGRIGRSVSYARSLVASADVERRARYAGYGDSARKQVYIEVYRRVVARVRCTCLWKCIKTNDADMRNRREGTQPMGKHTTELT